MTEFKGDGIFRGLFGLEGDGAAGLGGSGFRRGQTQLIEDSLHEFHVVDLRNVLKGDGLVGQAGGGHERHGFVLVSLRLDFPADRVAPPNKKAPVGDVRHERKMP